MELSHYKRREKHQSTEPDIADSNTPDWLIVEKESLLTKIETLNNQIAEIPDDAGFKNLKYMMKETAKALQMRLDELDEFTQRKPPAHKMISSKKH